MVYGVRWRTEKGWLREGVEGWWRNCSSQSQESLPTYSVPVYAIPTASRNADESERASSA